MRSLSDCRTSAVPVIEAILLTNRWSTRWGPIIESGACKPTHEWDPYRGPEAPTVHSGFSKARNTAQVEVFLCALPPTSRTKLWRFPVGPTGGDDALARGKSCASREKNRAL